MWYRETSIWLLVWPAAHTTSGDGGRGAGENYTIKHETKGGTENSREGKTQLNSVRRGLYGLVKKKGFNFLHTRWLTEGSEG